MSEVIDVRCVVVGMLEGNCYLVRCDPIGHGVIVDPGDEAGRIGDEVKAMNLEPEAILLTHGHIDHVNAAATLRRRFRSRVVCHASDIEMVKGGETLSLWGMQRNPCQVDQVVWDGDTIVVGGQTIKVLHTPGHTAGSVCYAVDSALFSGDTLFSGSIGRTDLPGGSEDQMMQSLKTRIATLADNTDVFPGHGPRTTIEYEKRVNPYL
jgi:hydroxyacylglutathione hydrolase